MTLYPPLRPALLAGALLVALGVSARSARAQQLYDPNVDAGAAIDSALALARAQHKLVLVDLGGEWCLDCRVLDRLFLDEAVASYLRAHFLVVRVDVGRFDRNLDIDWKYGHPIEGGVPAAVVLNGQGNVVVATRNGALESARNLTASDVLQLLQQWVALAEQS